MIRLSRHVGVTLHRTLRIPEDGAEHPLPPSLGAFEIHDAEDFGDAFDGFDVVVPIHRREAMWISFDAPGHRPHALKVGVGAACALTGAPFDPSRLGADPQDYLVVPDQPWLDGINSGAGTVRQFVAVDTGTGHSVESQVLGEEAERGGLELALFAPRPGRFPQRPAPSPYGDMDICCMSAAPMAVGAGGSIRQEIYEDEYGIDTWRATPAARLRIALVDAVDFAAMTGRPVPPTPVDARVYAAHGLPWFELYDPVRSDVAPAGAFAGVRGAAELAGHRDAPLRVAPGQVVTYVGRPPVTATAAR